MIDDGICKFKCQTSGCDYDKNDCLDKVRPIGCTETKLGNRKWEEECNNQDCNYDNGDAFVPLNVVIQLEEGKM
jgi:hypothetical protein